MTVRAALPVHRLLGLLFPLMVACQASSADTGWTPENGWSNEEPDNPIAVVEGLEGPRGLVVTPEGLVVAERDAGRVVAWVDGAIEVLAEGLDEPYMLATSSTGVVVTERGGGRVLHLAEETTVLAEGLSLPGRVRAEGHQAWWLDEEAGTLWQADLNTGESSVLASLSNPTGLDWSPQGLLVARAGGCDCVVLVDPDTGEETELTDVDENPTDVLATESGFYLSSESHYWPYGGWLYRVDPDSGATESLSYSPPGPSWLAANDTHLFWVSDENIVSVPFAGGTYQTLAILTAPGDLAVSGDKLYWTDRQRGSVLTVPVP
jgi:hypothetical protein